MKAPNTQQEQARVDHWNADHPIGTEVIRFQLMHPRRGTEHKTKTRSAAWLMGGHTAVVLVEGASGGIALDALELV